MELTNKAIKPILQEGEGEEDKNRSWTLEEAETYAANFELVKQSIESGRVLINERDMLFADVSTIGTWKNKGPYNMPGSFQFCEMDDGTDTVYAVTTGHYGGVQFIWKGTLKGDKWTMINPHDPSRFEDLIVIPNGNSRRVIAGQEMGKIIYSDDGGKTWTYAAGISGGIFSTIVNRQDNYVMYATDGKKVFRSTDKGASFSVFQTLGTGSINSARLYSPRWNIQPNAIDVYLAVDAKFYKLNTGKTTFTQVGTLPTAGGASGIICLGGDSRKLWMTLGRRKWYYSTNGGVNWTYQHTTNAAYDSPEDDMVTGQYLGIDPEDPNILIGGYTTPVTTRDGGVTTNIDAGKYWGYYQNSIGNDPKVRINYHPDLQGSQFFYDKAGKLLTLRSTDGGVFSSYNEWTKTSFPDLASIQNNVFYNITLFGLPSQETYSGGFIIGKNNINDMTTGTQDQGEQTTRLSSYNDPVLSWDQVSGGDGRFMITGDGNIGWVSDGYGAKFIRKPLYSGTTYTGQGGTQSPEATVFTDSPDFETLVADWSDGNRIWSLCSSLRRIEYNTATQAITGKQHNLANAGSNRIQGLAQSHVTPSVLYALHNGIVFKSTDRGTNWNQIATAAATGITGSYENRGSGWSSPLNEKIVLFASESGNSVKSILSKDGGITWKNVTGSGANLFPAAQVNGMAGTADGKLVFASTSMGPYVFVISEENWYPLAVDPKVPVFSGQVVYCQKYGGKEYARFSTWGQGIWDLEIDNTTTNTNELITNDQTIKIYPNPATAYTTISNLSIGDKISVYDISGKEVYRTVAKGEKEIISTSNFKSGIYIISLSGKSKFKLIKE